MPSGQQAVTERARVWGWAAAPAGRWRRQQLSSLPPHLFSLPPPAPLAAAAPAALRPSRRLTQARGTGQDAVGSWIDLASFVTSSGGGGGRSPYEELADKIGRDVYIDVAGWHL